MPHRIKYIMVGGFLGAGKTTTLGRLARRYADRGLNVGIVTNDQAADLVDTNTLRAQGFEVGEVAGACFCCNFDELISRIGELGEHRRPDVLLAEPVGSCTDLVATVIQPLKRLFDAEFDIAPYAVILKPSHGSRILRGEKRAGFSPKAAYILKKQLEEADAILVNRIDELEPDEVQAMCELVEEHYPGKPVLRVSAKTGAGFDALGELLEQRGDFGRRILDIDYDTYAEGEAELGWLNSSVRIRVEGRESTVESQKSEVGGRRSETTLVDESSTINRQPPGDLSPLTTDHSPGESFALDELLLEIISRLRDRLAADEAETAHLKTIGLWEGFFGVANLISSDSEPELSLPSNCDVKEVDVIVNARVACDPAVLERHVRAVVEECCAARNATPEFRSTQSFRPGRPVPTHRYATAE